MRESVRECNRVQERDGSIKKSKMRKNKEKLRKMKHNGKNEEKERSSASEIETTKLQKQMFLTIRKKKKKRRSNYPNRYLSRNSGGYNYPSGQSLGIRRLQPMRGNTFIALEARCTGIGWHLHCMWQLFERNGFFTCAWSRGKIQCSCWDRVSGQALHTVVF